MFKIVNDESVGVPSAVVGGMGLDELCRMAAQEMLAVALETERRAYLDAYADVTDETGRRVVTGNGYLPSRQVTTGAGMVEVRAPRVDDPRPDHRFSPAILRRYMRRSPNPPSPAADLTPPRIDRPDWLDRQLYVADRGVRGG